MRNKLMMSLAIMVVAVLVFSTGHVSVAARQSDDSLMDNRARLDGYRIFFSESIGEASRFDRSENGLSRLAGLLQRLGAELFTLEWRRNIPPDVDLVIMAGPQQDMSSEQVARLWAYLRNGGRLLLLVEPPFDQYRGMRAQSGLFELTWPDLSVRALDNIVATEGELRTITVVEQVTDEETGEQSEVERDYEAPELITEFVASDIFADHPITQDVPGELAFFSARTVEVDASLQIAEVVPLVTGPENYYGETEYQRYTRDGFVEYTDNDTTRGPQTLAAASGLPEGMRVVVIGDREFATNGFGLQTSPPNSPSFVYPGNVEFLLNAVAWLLEAEPVDLTLPEAEAAPPPAEDAATEAESEDEAGS